MSYKEWAKSTDNEEIDIYCAGYYDDGIGNDYPCYWKNKKLITLPGIPDSHAYSICAYNNDVYIVGDYMSGAQHACYWKNGKGPYNLDETGGISSGAYSIFIANDDIYISGYLWDTTNRACYWKNNKITILENNGTSQALEIKVIKNPRREILYISGYSQTGPQTACYWIDNTLYNLPHINDGQGNSIYIYKEKIYTAGNYTFAGGNNACYWIDQDGPYDYNLLDTQAHSIFVNNDIYIAGDRQTLGFYQARYFKDNTSIILANSGTQSQAKSIFFFDDTYYIAGFDQVGAYMLPVIWKGKNDFKLEYMNYIAGNNYFVESIFIKIRKE